MNENQIKEFFETRFPNIKGSREKAFSQFRALILVDNVDPELIVEKLKEYNDMCVKEGRTSKYIKDTHNWFMERGYLDTYTTKDSKTQSYLQRWLKGLKYMFA